jgi:hypothetical protein
MPQLSSLPEHTLRLPRAHLTFLQLTGLPSQSEAVKVAVGFIPRIEITNDSVA